MLVERCRRRVAERKSCAQPGGDVLGTACIGDVFGRKLSDGLGSMSSRLACEEIPLSVRWNTLWDCLGGPFGFGACFYI
jgi:hypothetical protein